MIVTVLTSVMLFSFISNGYMNKYFDDYIEEAYTTNVYNIVELGKIIINQGIQHRMILNSYISDPIFYAEIYDKDKQLILNSGMMGSGFKIDEDTMSIDSYEIIDGDILIGYAVIIRAKNTSLTETKHIFTKSIFNGGILASVIVLLIVGILGILVVRFISNDSKNVMNYVSDDSSTQTNSKIVEFSTIITAIKDYRHKLKLKETVKKEKFDNLLHETKTPITVLKSQLEGAVDRIIEIDSNRAKDMASTVDSLSDILENVTNVIEENYVEENIVLKEIDYSNSIKKIVESLRHKFESKGLKLDYKKTGFHIKTDEQMLNNVIYNILLNSYKYTYEGSVTIYSDKNKLHIIDTGIGIKEDELSKIFNPYYRGSNVADTKGEGLGLYNVKSQLDKLSIVIEVNSKVYEYTEITLAFM